MCESCNTQSCVWVLQIHLFMCDMTHSCMWVLQHTHSRERDLHTHSFICESPATLIHVCEFLSPLLLSLSNSRTHTPKRTGVEQESECLSLYSKSRENVFLYKRMSFSILNNRKRMSFSKKKENIFLHKERECLSLYSKSRMSWMSAETKKESKRERQFFRILVSLLCILISLFCGSLLHFSKILKDSQRDILFLRMSSMSV